MSNALRVLEAFLVLGEEVGVNEVARHLGLSPAVAQRLLVTLREHGFVQQDARTRKFRVGFKMLEIGLLCVDRESFSATALQAVHEAFPQYTAFVGILAEDEVLIVAAAEGNSQIRMGARAGESRPVHLVALGKAILADLPDEKVLEIVRRKGMGSLTPHSITDPERLLDDLRQTRSRGYAINDEESVVGGISIAVTLHNAAGHRLGAIGISTPKFMVTPDQVDELGQSLKALSGSLQGRLLAHQGSRA